MSAVDDLITWLRAQLDEDERLARQAFAHHNDAGPDWHEQWSGALNIGDAEELVITNDSQVSRFMEAFDPARVLAEVEAKRRILDAGMPESEHVEAGEYIRFGGWSSCSDDCPGTVWWEIVKLLAQPYAGRDGWREEWAATP